MDTSQRGYYVQPLTCCLGVPTAAVNMDIAWTQQQGKFARYYAGPRLWKLSNGSLGTLQGPVFGSYPTVAGRSSQHGHNVQPFYDRWTQRPVG
jgi:hypothetical protein